MLLPAYYWIRSHLSGVATLVVWNLQSIQCICMSQKGAIMIVSTGGGRLDRRPPILLNNSATLFSIAATPSSYCSSSGRNSWLHRPAFQAVSAIVLLALVSWFFPRGNHRKPIQCTELAKCKAQSDPCHIEPKNAPLCQPIDGYLTGF